ncbi:hypothetical protein CYMTET_34062 [Cymbomonas tetramitiformis]|uniref:Uncharacterized protein n=1 Tax=Cymbomonas tetramitiformis TaxID=36881 RepID=A0AAE0FBT6_9CHLO|nr:hypothetical protein CYMTET_34062 [Cymbomonas tetramitiformis]
MSPWGIGNRMWTRRRGFDWAVRGQGGRKFTTRVGTGAAWYKQERLAKGRKLAEEACIPSCRQFARTGVPSSLRCRIWANSLGLSNISEKQRAYFQRLCGEVEQRKMFTDSLVGSDVLWITRHRGHARSSIGGKRCPVDHQASGGTRGVHQVGSDVLWITDDERYFVFEENLRAVMLAFTRDTEVQGACSCAPHPALHGRGRDRNGANHGPFPPNGVVPFRGLVLYAAPLCYVYPAMEDHYFVFRALYCRHFCRLHVIDASDGLSAPALPGLCASFESILQEAQPEVVFRLVSLGVHPLRPAFSWLVHAFVGFLDPAQVRAAACSDKRQGRSAECDVQHSAGMH